MPFALPIYAHLRWMRGWDTEYTSDMHLSRLEPT